MTRGWLRNRLLKNRSEENRKLFKKKKKVFYFGENLKRIISQT